MRAWVIDTACVLFLAAFLIAAGFVIREVMDMPSLPAHGFSGMHMG
ncbi:hypothetical protein [Bradyrhizobium sp. 153]|nr:hypothetical protein [Bradyrhizobium sp. 153]MCK1668633.1 hypothetical protein [Bradyrhizobium sp. 153]